LIPDILDTLRSIFPTQEMDRDQLFSKVLHNTTVDKLTGAYNRQHFLELAESELPRARRYGHSLSAIVLTVDYSRPEDATYVPAIGAQVLQEVARRCQSNMRNIDLLGRYNGTKFGILLPETDLHAAQFVSERLRNCITGTPVDSEFGPLNVRVNLGVATVENDIPDAATLFERALAAMEAVPFTIDQKERTLQPLEGGGA
jgi:diguanylate cyclase (GGDEF)-like protein